jgi:hypothetical protein
MMRRNRAELCTICALAAEQDGSTRKAPGFSQPQADDLIQRREHGFAASQNDRMDGLLIVGE